MIMVSFFWKINVLSNKIKDKSVSSTMFLKLTIKVVAFFLGHPVYSNTKVTKTEHPPFPIFFFFFFWGGGETRCNFAPVIYTELKKKKKKKKNILNSERQAYKYITINQLKPHLNKPLLHSKRERDRETGE